MSADGRWDNSVFKGVNIESTGTTGTADGGTVVKVLYYKSEGRWFDS
jgi:hypothetical protein